MRISLRCLLLPLLFFCAAVLAAADSIGPSAVRDVRVGQVGSITRIVIESNGSLPYKLLNNSVETGWLELEIEGVEEGPSPQPLVGRELLVKETRAILMPKEKLIRYRFRTSGAVDVAYRRMTEPHRIVVDLVNVGTGQPAAPPVAVASTRKAWNRRIIVDPGHGGRHKGGIGKLGNRTVYEKEITIQVANRLEKLLKADDRFTVIFTRRQDVYMGLQERTDFASQNRGDLFISLHTNAVPIASMGGRARGFEIWVWDQNGNKSAAAKALESLENDDGSVTQNNSNLIGAIMRDALQSQALTSRKVAQVVHSAFIEDPYFRRHDRGIQGAKFKVLEIYDMPSILIEMGFITHPEEVKLLFQARFQQDLAEATYRGIVRYYEQSDSTFPRSPRGAVAAAK